MIFFLQSKLESLECYVKHIVKYIKTVGSNLIEASINCFDSCMKQIKIFVVKVYFSRRKIVAFSNKSNQKRLTAIIRSYSFVVTHLK